MDTRDLLVAIIPLIVLQLSITAWALVDISKRKNLRYLPKVAWVLISIFVTLGAVVYLAIGRGEE